GGGHDFFDFIGIAREAFTEQLVAGFDDKDIVFDAHAEILFGDVDAGLNGNDHAGLESGAMVAGVVNVQADGMAEAVDEIGPEGFAMEIFPVRVDVVVGNFLHALVAFAAKIHARLELGEGGVLRAENDFIDFTLARGELAIGGKGARDVRGITGVLRTNVKNDDVAIFDFARELVVVERGGIQAGADNGRVALRFRTTPG